LVTFHLTNPDPEFLLKLAHHSATVLPANAPPRPAGRLPLPATGPYQVARFSPGHELVLERNPRFREWSRAAQPRGYPDRIVIEAAVPRARAVSAVVEGRADLLTLGFFASLSAEQQRRLSTQHAGQVRLSPLPIPYYLFLNTRVPPFNDVRARRAVAYAVDRGAIVAVAGGPAFAQPTCQVLPLNFPGFRPYCPYTVNPTAAGQWKAPDLARARALVAASDTRGARVTVSVLRRFASLGQRAAADLRRIGYHASLRVFPDYERYLFYFADSRNRAQAAVQAYGADYPAASTFFRQFTCHVFVPNSANAANGNLAEFCDPSIDRMIERARELQVTDVQAANALWARIDRAIVDAAPVVPLYVPKAFDLVSKRVGNYEYSPQYGVLLDQLWVR
jgi:peptide/nickel transport system substrate-binding protein